MSELITLKGPRWLGDGTEGTYLGSWSDNVAYLDRHMDFYAKKVEDEYVLVRRYGEKELQCTRHQISAWHSKTLRVPWVKAFTVGAANGYWPDERSASMKEAHNIKLGVLST